MKQKHPLRIAVLFGLVVCLIPAHADEFRFDWPLPSSVLVKASADKRGVNSTVSYRATLNTVDDKELNLSFSDFRFLTLDGASADSPEIKKKIGPLLSLMSALPSMRISRDGEYLGTVGMAELTQKMLQSLPEDMEAKGRERLTQHFQSPQMQQVFQQKSGESWNIWVGAWNGLSLARGETAQHQIPVKTAGEDLMQQVHIEHLGRAASYCDNCVRLQMNTLMEGPQVLQWLGSMMRGAVGQGAGDIFAGFSGARSSNITEIVIDPDGLLPYYAASVSEVSLTRPDGEPAKQQETKEYWFVWE